ncbi:hypothetical protein D3C84_484510 [compost metagenome]
MHAHRFTQPAGIDVGGAGEEQHPEQAHAAHLQGQQFSGQRADGGEVTDKGQAGEDANGQPHRVFGRAAQQLVQAPGCGLQLDPLVTFALGDLFAPHEQPGERTLRAGVAAPHASGEHGDREQAEGADDQQRREQDEILWPEGRAKDVEFALRKVPEHGLSPAPVQPHGAKKRQKQKPRTAKAQVAEQSGEASGVNLVVAGFGLHLWTRRLECFY